MPRQRNTKGKSHVGLYIETLHKLKAIAEVRSTKDQMIRTYANTITELANEAYANEVDGQ